MAVKINFINYPMNRIFSVPSEKKQIVLHHTVSYGTPMHVINYWRNAFKNGKPLRIATHFIIGKDGKVFQLFNTKYWAYHIGKTTKELDMFGLKPYNHSKYSIGIEMVSLGGLVEHDGVIIDTYGKPFAGNIYEFDTPFRGYKYFDKYTDEQIESMLELVKFLNNKFNIPIKYSNDIFQLSKDALIGKSGLYSHVSYRLDKSDLAPQEHLVEALKTL